MTERKLEAPDEGQGGYGSADCPLMIEFIECYVELGAYPKVLDDGPRVLFINM